MPGYGRRYVAESRLLEILRMNNPWSPSPDDVRDWAQSTPNPWSDEPCEDWPLALTWAQHEKAYLELASDNSCPAQTYMLFILYFIVGYAVHSGLKPSQQTIIEGFITLGDQYPHPDILKWQQRSEKLLNNPKTFDYEQWCGGGYVRHAT